MTAARRRAANVDALIFDLFGVLIAFDEDIVYRRLAEHCAEPDRAFVAMQGLVSRGDLIRGQVSLAQLHEELINAHRLGLSLPDFEACWRLPYSSPMPGMAQLLRTLSSRRKLVLLSNVDRDYWQCVRSRHSELHEFSSFVLSCETGFAKPEPRAFQIAIERCGFEASRCYFVDDKMENVDAAERLGLRGHCFKDAQGLRAALARLGVD